VLLLFLLPAILSFLVLAAHFLRGADYLAVLALLALVPLLRLRRPWVSRVARSTLWLGTGVWLYATARFTADRLRLGEPYLRMVLILGGVALFTALASLPFFSRRLRTWYAGGAGDAASGSRAAEPEPVTVERR